MIPLGISDVDDSPHDERIFFPPRFSFGHLSNHIDSWMSAFDIHSTRKDTWKNLNFLEIHEVKRMRKIPCEWTWNFFNLEEAMKMYKKHQSKYRWIKNAKIMLDINFKLQKWRLEWKFFGRNKKLPKSLMFRNIRLLNDVRENSLTRNKRMDLMLRRTVTVYFCLTDWVGLCTDMYFEAEYMRRAWLQEGRQMDEGKSFYFREKEKVDAHRKWKTLNRTDRSLRKREKSSMWVKVKWMCRSFDLCTYWYVWVCVYTESYMVVLDKCGWTIKMCEAMSANETMQSAFPFTLRLVCGDRWKW